MKIDDIQDNMALPNGAEVLRTSYACELCVVEGQEPAPTSFMIEYQGQQVQVCDAHAQKMLDALEDEQKKGVWDETFRVQ